MAETIHFMSARHINQVFKQWPTKSPKLQTSKICAAAFKKNDFSLITKKSSKSPRRLITISTSDGRWHTNWSTEYLVSLQDLQLEDLVEDEHKDANVSINLSIQKHASFGFSVDGRIISSFTRKCSNCSSPYCREVIYVKPGYQAELDSLVQDTIRLTTTVKDTCSESCEKSDPKIQYIGAQNTASVDKRWGRLLELRNAYL
ncbi:hypothetical protein Pint_22672 [Pistacia integerrima]|uniref:Uncharacterized protein n=1 Tax=Pistacia integerrima TaxID=434235 RepID=A0ACC0YKH0_9ROSI|nr:hypothetical protein Pint_22672 [Pistacia integerrima]